MSRALGRYELLRPLARGGMAEVYLARRRAAGVEKWLVVKRIRPERSGDVRFLDLFVREARLSMSLAHQNIVPVFDFGRIDDQVFLAMERIEGKDLGSTLDQAGDHAAPPLVAAFIAAECCQALSYAHHRKSPDGAALGIVHRDVTPRNVLLSWSGEVKLTDFGIAALAGDDANKLIGTPAYMAPEQARGEPVDARADVYAIGLVLRELLTGVRARSATEREAMLEAARTGGLGPWPMLPTVAPALRAVVDRATAALPDDRFPDAQAMLTALDEFIVAERAAHRSEAPARLLAAWLATAWEGNRDDPALDGDVAGDHLVSFLDDGALDVIGTGTQRSLAATAAEEDAARIVDRAEEELPSSVAIVDLQPAEAPSRLPAARRWWVVGGMGVIVGVIAMLLVRGSGDDPVRTASPPTPPRQAETTSVATAQPPAPATPTSPGAGGPVPSVNPIGDPSSDPNSNPRSDPRIVAGESPASVPPTIPTRTRPSTTPEPARLDVPAAPPTVPTMRKVTINATPWAYFTVDGDPTRHETMKTLELAPGPHRVHFNNPVLQIERAVTIDVPADRDVTHVERLGAAATASDRAAGSGSPPIAPAP